MRLHSFLEFPIAEPSLVFHLLIMLHILSLHYGMVSGRQALQEAMSLPFCDETWKHAANCHGCDSQFD